MTNSDNQSGTPTSKIGNTARADRVIDASKIKPCEQAWESMHLYLQQTPKTDASEKAIDIAYKLNLYSSYGQFTPTYAEIVSGLNNELSRLSKSNETLAKETGTELSHMIQQGLSQEEPHVCEAVIQEVLSGPVAVQSQRTI